MRCGTPALLSYEWLGHCTVHPSAVHGYTQVRGIRDSNLMLEDLLDILHDVHSSNQQTPESGDLRRLERLEAVGRLSQSGILSSRARIRSLQFEQVGKEVLSGVMSSQVLTGLHVWLSRAFHVSETTEQSKCRALINDHTITKRTGQSAGGPQCFETKLGSATPAKCHAVPHREGRKVRNSLLEVGLEL